MHLAQKNSMHGKKPRQYKYYFKRKNKDLNLLIWSYSTTAYFGFNAPIIYLPVEVGGSAPFLTLYTLVFQHSWYMLIFHLYLFNKNRPVPGPDSIYMVTCKTNSENNCRSQCLNLHQQLYTSSLMSSQIVCIYQKGIENKKK